MTKQNKLTDQEKSKEEILSELRACRQRADAVEQNLADVTAQLGVVLDTLPALISYVDEDYRYIFVSRSYAERYNRDKEDIVGQKAADVIGETAFESVKSEVDRALAGERVEYEKKMEYKDDTRWTQTILEPDIDENGDTKGFIALVTDITEQRLAEERMAEAQAFSNSLINSLPGIFYLYNADQELVRWNDNFADVTGYDENELLGISPRSFFEGEDIQAIQDSVNQVFEEGEAVTEADLITKKGETIPYLFTGTMMELQGVPYLGGIGMDISQRKETEQELQRHREELEEMVEERTRTIQQQMEEILELSTPILQVWEGIVIAPLIGALDSRRTQHFMEVLLERIVDANAEVALIDITGVPTIDTQTAQHLIETISAVRLLGARVVLTGVRPSIAQTLVHLGIDLSDMTTRFSLATGLRIALEMTESSLRA